MLNKKLNIKINKKQFLVVFIINIFIASAFASSVKAEVSEYQVKAAFLYNFTKFIEWPESAFSGGGSPFVIGVLGKDPFKNIIDETVKGKSYKKRPIQIKRASSPDELKGCQMIFISTSEKSNIAKIINSVKSGSVLTVSEYDGFIGSGGIINFFLESGKTRFEIHQTNAEKINLKISSQLLKLAKIVK